jgi:hypothetical protein
MEFHTLFQFFPSARAFTPRHFGVNAETLLYADQSNHWDWLADSGFSFVRIFAPDVNLRKHPVQPGLWGEISDEADFQNLRKQMRENPHGDLTDKDAYLFDQNIAWYGCLNAILEQCKNIGMAPMLSVGWHPRMFPRPLLREDGSTDWEAAFCCYEYAFTVMHHRAEKFGMREFMTLNEPENQPDCWYLSEELDFCREGFGRVSGVRVRPCILTFPYI